MSTPTDRPPPTLDELIAPIREALRWMYHREECRVHVNGPDTCNCGSDEARHAATAALRELRERQAENYELRKILFFTHGNVCGIHALYGDDGEMTCNACGTDFKRNTIEQMEAMNERRIRRSGAPAAGKP